MAEFRDFKALCIHVLRQFWVALQAPLAVWLEPDHMVQLCNHCMYLGVRNGLWDVGIIQDAHEQCWQVWCFCSML